MENLDEIKAMWIDLNSRLSVVEEENRRLLDIVKNDKYKSIRQRLLTRYRAFIILALSFAIVCPAFLLLDPMVVEKFRLATAIYWCLFMLAAAGVDFYLYSIVRRMDVYNSTVLEMTKMAANNWKIHKLWIIIGMPVAFGAVILWGLAMDADNFVILCMIIGGVIGGVIGGLQLRKFWNDYKNLSNN